MDEESNSRPTMFRTTAAMEDRTCESHLGRSASWPISVRIPQAVAMTGFSRSRLYELIKSGEIAIAKDGSCTLVLVDSLRAAVERRVIHR